MHSNQSSFRCHEPGCEKIFATKQRLRVHTLIHGNYKPFVCPEDGCFKTFREKGNLKTHIRSHTGEKPFKCTIENCDKYFTTQSHLKDHKKRHIKAQTKQNDFYEKSNTQSNKVLIPEVYAPQSKSFNQSPQSEMINQQRAQNILNNPFLNQIKQKSAFTEQNVTSLSLMKQLSQRDFVSDTDLLTIKYDFVNNLKYLFSNNNWEQKIIKTSEEEQQALKGFFIFNTQSMCNDKSQEYAAKK